MSDHVWHHESKEVRHPFPETDNSPPTNWVDIAIKLALRNDLISLKILEKLYISPGQPYILDELLRAVIKPYDKRKKMTLWRRVVYLEKMNLLEKVKGKPMSVYPKRDIEKSNISKLLNLCYSKMVGDSYIRS